MTAKAKTRVGRTAKGGKRPVPTRQKLQEEITTLRREVGKHKEAPSRKHKEHGTKKHSTKRGLALTPADAECCAAESLAASLRLAGQRVSADDVLGLHLRTAGNLRARASILATLKVASESGLAGHRPAFEEVMSSDYRSYSGGPRVSRAAGLILGAELPGGPHCVTAAPDGTWWSWGEPYDPSDFPGAVIEECWAVTWQ